MVAHGDQFLGRALDRKPGVGIGRGDLGEGGEKVAQSLLVFGQPAAVLRPQGVLKQGVDVNRPAQTMGGFIVGDAGSGVAHPHGGPKAAVVLIVVKRLARPQALHQRPKEFGPDHKAEIVFPPRDPLAEHIDQLLGRIAAHVGIDGVARVRAQDLGEAGRRVGKPWKGQLRQAARGVDGEADDG